MESWQEPKRESGAAAWSLRVHQAVEELSYNDFVLRFAGPAGGASPGDAATSSGNVIPFHRIAYVRQRGAAVWCASGPGRVRHSVLFQQVGS